MPGFMSIPGGGFEAAPGAEGTRYDRSLGRWVSTLRGLSPDGLSEVYLEGDYERSHVHLVDVRTGSDRVLASGGPWQILGQEPEGIYLLSIVFGPDSPAFGRSETYHGVWLLPWGGGATTRVTADTRHWQLAGAGRVWGRKVNQADPHPWIGDSTFPNEIVALDLKTNTVQQWLYRPGMGVTVIGSDPLGVPFVEANNNERVEIWRLDAPNPPAPIWSGRYGEPGPSTPVVADGKTVWFSGSTLPNPPYFSGVYSWTSEAGLKLVPQPDERRYLVAGPCA